MFDFCISILAYLYTPGENTVKNSRPKFIYGSNCMHVENLNQLTEVVMLKCVNAVVLVEA